MQRQVGSTSDASPRWPQCYPKQAVFEEKMQFRAGIAW